MSKHRATARRAEQEIADGKYRGPLHGVPVAIKDLLAMRGNHHHRWLKSPRRACDRL